MEENKPEIYLAIVNITSWVGISSDATHVYGHLILSEKKGVTVDNVEDSNVKYLGEKIELTRPLTQELAIALDKIDDHNTNQRHFRWAQEKPEWLDENAAYGETNRFDTFTEVVNAGIAKWQELDIDCPLISLYEGEKYAANSYEPSDTVIMQYNKNNNK